MKIILLEDVHGIGAAGATATVSDGYARNFLIPRKLAIAANEGNMKDLERRRASLHRRQVKEANTAETLAEKISGLTLTLMAKAGEGNRLYGSITNADIAEKLSAKGVEIDRHHILIEHPIRMLGPHEVKVHLHKNIDATLKVEIVAEESAA